MISKLKAGTAILVTLISTLAITGISFIDDALWEIIMVVVGMIAYSIVGLLFSIGFLSSRNAGKEAYAVVFLGLLVLGYFVCQGLKKLRLWILSWHLAFKIIVPILLVLSIIAIIVFMIIWNEKNGYEEYN